MFLFLLGLSKFYLGGVLLATSKPIATISYNTQGYLNMVLSDLYKRHIISEFYYIYHKPEDDESRLKAHYHLLIIPNCRLDPMDLTEKLREADPCNPLKPLGCIEWRQSVVDEWFAYCVHDRDYLAFKNQSRVYHYQIDEMFCHDTEFRDSRFWRAMHASSWREAYDKQRLIGDITVSPVEMVKQGRVPLALFSQMRAFRQAQFDDVTFRNGRTTHTPKEADEKVDRETGEITERVFTCAVCGKQKVRSNFLIADFVGKSYCLDCMKVLSESVSEEKTS